MPPTLHLSDSFNFNWQNLLTILTWCIIGSASLYSPYVNNQLNKELDNSRISPSVFTIFCCRNSPQISGLFLTHIWYHLWVGFMHLHSKNKAGGAARVGDMPWAWLKEKKKRWCKCTPLQRQENPCSDVAYILWAHVSAKASYQVKWGREDNSFTVRRSQ